MDVFNSTTGLRTVNIISQGTLNDTAMKEKSTGKKISGARVKRELNSTGLYNV